ncbi:MAG: aldehyde dehydrogenase family protein [Myxococcota bacterium]|nr:aldehyde dehydrogenase family protein [Myxococcota bacterium]
MSEPGPPLTELPARLEVQRRYFAEGLTRSRESRLAALAALRELLTGHADALVAALQADLPRPALEAWASELAVVRHEIDHARAHLTEWLEPVRPSWRARQPFDQAEVRREPAGCVLILGPWNYPLHLVLAPLVAALAAGNCALLKPSELAPHTARLLAELVGQVFHPGLVTVVQGGVETAQALLALPFDHIFFTGGPAVGRLVMRAAAEHLTPVTLELGGKSPCLVDQDVPLRRALQRILWGKFFHAGQTCVAPDYLLVDERIHDRLLVEAGRVLREFYGVDPRQSPDYARIVSARHFARLEALLAGQPVVWGGERDPATRFFGPTLVDRPRLDSALLQEEIFGPILPVLSYRDLPEALAIVRALPPPLALYVFSRDEGFVAQVLDGLRYGGACVNDTLLQLDHPELPFGGVGDSGLGRYHGRAGFDELTRPTSILRRSLAIETGLRFPPYGHKLGAVKRLV